MAWAAVAASLALSAALVVLTLRSAVPGRWAGAALLAALVASGGVAPAADLLAGRRPRPHPGTAGPQGGDADGRPGAGPVPTVGMVVRLGDEPVELARSAVALAAAAGPAAVVVTSDRTPPDGLPDGVHVVTAPSSAAGVHLAARALGTDAVLVVSGRALPDAGAIRRIAEGPLRGAQAVSGRSVPVRAERFGPGHRDGVDAVLRRRAVDGGLVLWQPDATVVRSSLLLADPPAEGVPMGTWLRARSAAGARVAQVDDVVSHRAAPVAAEGYWPDTVARRRGEVADLADAVVRSRGARHRLLAAALLARALSGWAVLGWVLLPVVLAGGAVLDLPTGVPPVAYAATVAAVLGLRWAALRWSVRVPPSTSDLLGACYAAPAAVAATGAALRRRVRRPRRPVPTRPLLWGAVVAALAGGVGLLAGSPSASGSRWAAVTGLAVLATLWTVTVRLLVERDWARASFRVRLDQPVTVGVGSTEVAGRLVDGSPGGLAVALPPAGPVPVPAVVVGGPVVVTVAAPGGGRLRLAGTVASGRRRRGGPVLGVALDLPVDAVAPWTSLLLDAAGRPPGQGHARRGGAHVHGPHADAHAVVDGAAGAPGRSPALAVLDRLAVPAAVAASLAFGSLLVLVLLGYLPMVVRSSSMVPTYRPGDVVVVDRVPVEELRVGDVVSRLDAPGSGTDVTHRVTGVDRSDGRVVVSTRGDANRSGEQWQAADGQLVGRAVLSVPMVGRPVTWLRTPVGSAVLGAGLALVVGAVALGWRRRHRAVAPAAAAP